MIRDNGINYMESLSSIELNNIYNNKYRRHIPLVLYKKGGKIPHVFDGRTERRQRMVIREHDTPADNMRTDNIGIHQGYYPTVPIVPKTLYEAADESGITMVPFVGDAIDGIEAVNLAIKGNYGTAALSTSMLLLPNIIEKPAKKVVKKLTKPVAERVDNLLRRFKGDNYGKLLVGEGNIYTSTSLLDAYNAFKRDPLNSRIKLSDDDIYMIELLAKNNIDISKYNIRTLQALQQARGLSLTLDGRRFVMGVDSNLGGRKMYLYGDELEKPLGYISYSDNPETGLYSIDYVENLTLKRPGVTPSKGVSESLYNGAIQDIRSMGGEGIKTGELLASPEATEKVWEHYPNKIQLSEEGIWRHTDPNTLQFIYEGGHPVYLLDKPSYEIPLKSLYFDPNIIDDEGNLSVDWNGDKYHSKGGSMKTWDKLSMRDRHSAIRKSILNIFANGGSIRDLSIDDIRKLYNTGRLYEGESEDNLLLVTPKTTGGAGYVPSYNYEGKNPIENLSEKTKEWAYRLLYGDLPREEIQRRLYTNIFPYTYTDAISRVLSAVLDNVRHEYDTQGLYEKDRNARDDIFAEYLGIPLELRRVGREQAENPEKYFIVQNSEYKPTIGTNNDVLYKRLALDRDHWDKIYRDIYTPPRTMKLFRRKTPLAIGLNDTSEAVSTALGTHTVGRGYDDKGEYMSYADVWDLNPFGLFNGEIDLSFGIGTPVHIYDRMYLDDYFGIDNPNHATYLPKITITPKKNGGKLFGKGGPVISDEEYLGRMRQVAQENWRNWGYRSEEEAYQDQINNPTYDYRSFYANNPGAVNNAETHWPDTYKGALHRTFSDESIYNGKVNPTYNPSGVKGGRWTEKGYVPHGEQFAVPFNMLGEGGKIHIKPENRGKFTALKKRTGHSASWFKAHGTPAQRKMATFALNSRKWKHGDGGNLFDEGGLKGSSPNEILEKYKGTPHDLNIDKDFFTSGSFSELMNRWNLAEDEEVSNWFHSYVNSPGFERIKKNLYKWIHNRHPYLSLLPDWLVYNDLAETLLEMVNKYWKDTKVFPMDMFALLSAYSPKTRNAYVGRDEYRGFNYPFVAGHEFAHGFNAGYPYVFGSQIEALDTNKNTNLSDDEVSNYHDSLNDEKHGDIWGMKYLLYKEGIYDSRSNKDITPELVLQLREKYPNLRPLLLMDNKKAAWMLNHVAHNNTLQDFREQFANQAASGGPIVKAANKHLYDGESEDTLLVDIANSYPMSLQDYIAQRIQDTKDSAVNVMNTRKTPLVIYSNITGNLRAQQLREEYKGLALEYIKLIMGSNTPNATLELKKKAEEANAELVKLNNKYNKEISRALAFGDGYIPEGSTCLYTLTDSYGKNRRVAGNLSWIAKQKGLNSPLYALKGFRKLSPEETLQQGDIVLFGAPKHAEMFMDYSSNRKPKETSYPIITTYSNGSYGPEAMKRNADYNWFNSNENNAFRFVGNAADSARWTKEYNELILSGPIVEKALGGHLFDEGGETGEEYYPIWLDGITVKPSGNRPTTRDDWNWANWRELQNEIEQQAAESVRRGIDRNGTPIATGIYGLAAAPFAIESLGSSAVANGVRTGLQAMNAAFTPSTWLNPVTGAKLLSPTVGTIADAGIQGAFAYEGLNGLWNQGREGTLLSDPTSTFMHGLEVLPLIDLGSKAIGSAYRNLANSNIVKNRGFALPINNTLYWVGRGLGSEISLTPGTEGYMRVSDVLSKSPGTGRKLYDAAIKHAQNNGYRGIESGNMLLSAPKTYSIWEHYPNRQLLGNYGMHNNFNMASYGELDNVGSVEDMVANTANGIPTKFEGAPVYGLIEPSVDIATKARHIYSTPTADIMSVGDNIITGVNNSSEPSLFSAYRTIIPKYIDKVKNFNGSSKFERAIEGFFPILNPTYAKALAKSPELIDHFNLYEFPDFSPSQVKAFQKVWAEEAAKGPYSMNGMLKFAKPSKRIFHYGLEDIPKLFEDARQIKKIEDTAYRYGRLIGNFYNSRYNEITDPVLKHIVDVSPQYINEVYAQHLKGGKATEPFVKHLIQRANNYRRFMVEPHSPEEFGTMLGNFRQNGKSTIDVEGMHVSGDYGRFGAYFQGQPTLKGDISTWWDQRIPEGVTVHPGMHSLYPPKISENLYGDLINNRVRQHGALAMPIERSFWKGYNESDATLNFLHWPTHQVFEGPRGSTLPNFKITLLEDGMPSDFSWGKGYKYGGPLVEYAMGGKLFGEGGQEQNELSTGNIGFFNHPLLSLKYYGSPLYDLKTPFTVAFTDAIIKGKDNFMWNDKMYSTNIDWNKKFEKDDKGNIPFQEFANYMYPAVIKILKEKGLPLTNAHNIVRLAGLESQYGTNPVSGKGYNLSGIKWNSKTMGNYNHATNSKDNLEYVDFDNLKDYLEFKIDLLNNRYDAINAESDKDFVDRLHLKSSGINKKGFDYSTNYKGYLNMLLNTKSLDKWLKLLYTPVVTQQGNL